MMNQNLKNLLRKYSKKLGLKDYKIETVIAPTKHYICQNGNVEEYNTADNYYAEITEANYGKKEFVLLINKWALQENIKDTVIHELLHALLWGLTDIIEQCIPLLNVSDDDKSRLKNKLDEREHEVIEKLIKAIK